MGAGLTKVLQLHGGPGIPDSHLQPYCLYNVMQRETEFELIGNPRGEISKRSTCIVFALLPFFESDLKS